MSYDIDLRAPVCATCGNRGPEPSHLPDPTYNLTEIFHLALTGEQLPNPDVSEFSAVVLAAKTDGPRGLRVLNGRKGIDTIPLLDAALARLRDPQMQPAFLALEPPNKWGDLPGAIRVIADLRTYAEAFGGNTWEIH